jgi:hypothetical protein
MCRAPEEVSRCCLLVVEAWGTPPVLSVFLQLFPFTVLSKFSTMSKFFASAMRKSSYNLKK